MTIVTLRILRKEIESANRGGFHKEICRIKFIYWTFVLTYTAWFAYELINISVPKILSGRKRFTDEIIDIAMLNIFVCIPILVVLSAHFMSYSSVSRLLKIVMALK